MEAWAAAASRHSPVGVLIHAALLRHDTRSLLFPSRLQLEMVSSDRITVCRPASGISASPKRATLLVLLTDTPVPAVRKSHGTYHDVFSSLFQRSLDAHPLDLELTVKSFDVVNEPWEYPSEQDLSESSGLLITGSGEWLLYAQCIMNLAKKVSHMR